MNHTVSSYRKVQVETADSLKLVVMLYEGAINFLEQAKRRLTENQIADKGILINKVVSILSELQGSLNMKEGGEIATRLDGLYTYMINRLLDGNINNDPSVFNEIIGHLRMLREAWKKISDNGNGHAVSMGHAEKEAADVGSESVAKPEAGAPAPIELVG